MVSTGPDVAVQIAAVDNLIEAGRILEVRGIQGNSTDRDRHVEVERILAAYPNVEVVEVVGSWDASVCDRSCLRRSRAV